LGFVFELLIALSIVAALILAAVVPPLMLLWVGVVLGTFGALLGVPAGLIYHARLWRALRERGQPTTGFWLRPHHLHDKLSAAQLGPIQAWFFAGVVGFGLTLLGAVGVVAGVVRFASL
jgi:hypothetical protein